MKLAQQEDRFGAVQQLIDAEERATSRWTANANITGNAPSTQ
jgi:hypothetical protein